MEGASICKGERATHIIFTKHVVRKDDDSGEDKPGMVVKGYPVFNIDQIDGLDDMYRQPQQEPNNTQATHEKAIAFVRGTGIGVQHGANKAAYYPTRDEVVMPDLAAFVNEAAYWGVLNHELTHATGHKDRLDRTFGRRFGYKAYAFEELVAELGSAFLCARLGIEPSFRSASYIESWLKVLTDDNRAIFSAASYAGHAAHWLWKRSFGEVEEKRLEAAE
ncbi:ArdC family protein [Rhizobium sp. SYY.PMSO]|uniref:ArdC family protein n=1 Tax=Rhizobium sp. SYY.PMSO TaxID=3382192 RepID=UPI00398FA2AF